MLYLSRANLPPTYLTDPLAMAELREAGEAALRDLSLELSGYTVPDDVTCDDLTAALKAIFEQHSYDLGRDTGGLWRLMPPQDRQDLMREFVAGLVRDCKTVLLGLGVAPAAASLSEEQP